MKIVDLLYDGSIQFFPLSLTFEITSRRNSACFTVHMKNGNVHRAGLNALPCISKNKF